MEDMKGIEVDALFREMYIVCPNLPQSKEFSKQMRAKLEEQIKRKTPKVELEQLDLSYIILNAKKSLSEYQSRIDDTIAQQKLRRTTRVRKANPNYQDSPLIQWQQTNSRVKLSSPSPSPSPSTSTKSNIKMNCASIQTETTKQSEADFDGLVQVESLPSSASRNLVTILIPSLLQEKLQSFKYKISIDLNRLDLTKKILDSNISQTESDTTSVVDSIQRHELIYEIKDPNNLQLLDETQTAVSNIPRVEVKTPLHESEASTTISIVRGKGADTAAKAKQRAPKRTCPQPLKIKEPPKKRGRKPGSKNKAKQEKSELAKYVEMFECNGNSPSSAVSQVVTSTTKNWEIPPDQTAQIAYFMNGEWTTLSAPPNNDPNTMVTTTNLEDAAENENFIPFDDFVNFIDNPSVDVGNNVIAQVLGDAIDTHDEALNPQQQDNPKQGELSIEQPKNTQPTQYNLPGQNIANIIQSPTSRQYDLPGQNTVDSIVQSPTCRQQTAIVDNCSKQINPDVLSANTNQENNVIFSTGRSMPSLDISDEVLFYSTPERTNIADSVIAFSTEPYKATTSDHNPSIQEHEDTITNDSAIGMDKRESPSDSPKDETIASNCVKNKSEGIKEMSLLEIEKDFDDSLLEFNNLDDDLLSLAPSSCFNSPVDDRFSDSIFVSDESKANTNPAPRSHLESSLVTLNEDVINPALKTYKIPRVKIIKNISIEKKTNKPNPTHNSPPIAIASAIKNHSEGASSSATAEHQSHSTSLNAGVKQSLDTSSRVDTNSNQIESSKMMSTLEISKLFGSLCNKFLADMCFEPTCKASHQLLDIGIISISLSLLRNEVLNAAYRFVWRNYKLFKLYFAMFCEEFGRRNMRQKLLSMVHDCQLQPKCTFFLKNVYMNLLVCGLGRVNACRLLLNRVEDRSHPTIDVLLEIIIESDAQMFSSTIEQFSNVNGYKFSMKHINELATVCLRSGSVELVPVLIKCLIDVDQNDFLTLRSPELIQLLEMIKSGDV